MNDEKWLDVVEKIKDKFEIIEREKIDLEDGGVEESIVFESPLGKMKIVRTVRPRAIDQGRQVGRHGTTALEHEGDVSLDRMMYQMEIFKWDNYADDWTKASLEL